MKNNRANTVEVLAFRMGDARATLATNGRRHVVQQGSSAREFKSLRKAVAHLVGSGYSIDNDNWCVI